MKEIPSICIHINERNYFRLSGHVGFRGVFFRVLDNDRINTYRVTCNVYHSYFYEWLHLLKCLELFSLYTAIKFSYNWHLDYKTFIESE